VGYNAQYIAGMHRMPIDITKLAIDNFASGHLSSLKVPLNKTYIALATPGSLEQYGYKLD